MNEVMLPKNEQYALFSENTRIVVLFLAALVLILAISGSAGDASYQLRLARDDARQDKDTKLEVKNT